MWKIPAVLGFRLTILSFLFVLSGFGWVFSKSVVDGAISGRFGKISIQKRVILMATDEYNETIAQCVMELDMIANDTSVPRNIRRSVTEIISILQNDNQELFLRATSGLSILSDVSSDPNLPMHTGTLIWSILGKLETIPPEV
ncbi:UPF0147 family protein [Methanolapillus ohkumae]